VSQGIFILGGGTNSSIRCGVNNTAAGSFAASMMSAAAKAKILGAVVSAG
jgi:hypothetical protein